MAKQKIVLMPPAELTPRDSDIVLPPDQFLKFSFFGPMKRKPGIERFPGTLILRHFQKGEVICRQGEAGWTAFYVLTTEDDLAVRQYQLETATEEPAKQALRAEIARLEQRRELGKTVENPTASRAVALVHLAVARPPEPKAKGLWSRLTQRSSPRGRKSAGSQPRYIPIDGPRDVSYDTREAALYEGELFGEISCLYGTPRSATVVANRDCFMLEMLRNILDQVQKDEAYKAQMDRIYKERILQNHLRKLSLLGDLTEEQFAVIREQAELLRLEGDQVILDEHDRPDSVYIIRSGLVKVVKNVSALLGLADVPSWPALCKELLEGERQAEGPRRHLWHLLPPTIRESIRLGLNATGLEPAEQQEILYALSDLIKSPTLSEAKEWQALAASAAASDRIPGLPADRKKWSARQLRSFNRVLLEALYPKVLRPWHNPQGLECILAYRARGDLIGEIGVLLGQPRMATCITHVHPRPQGAESSSGRDSERVELVRIPGEVFRQLIASSPAIREKVEQEIARRSQSDTAALQVQAWGKSPPQVSGRFNELGLIQGQRLMLIDLERCTRCDECVRACVDTHDDGRSRLFLDGPRWGKYLVPISCRACLDPVCMIGCPVGSIHRGDNLEMVIENWCIGCGLCDKNCPYGSIQMYDIGIIPEGAHGWRYLPAAAVMGSSWTQARDPGRRWLLGRAPFLWDRDFQARLLEFAKPEGPPTDLALCFRYQFELGADLLQADSDYRLEIASTDSAAQVWINGELLKTDEKPKRGKTEYLLGRGSAPLRARSNVVAVKLVPKQSGSKEVLLDVRLDAIRKPIQPYGLTGDISEKPVTERAVVCDLCSAQADTTPACVHACPHDAALRVDARFDLPRW